MFLSLNLEVLVLERAFPTKLLQKALPSSEQFPSFEPSNSSISFHSVVKSQDSRMLGITSSIDGVFISGSVDRSSSNSSAVNIVLSGHGGEESIVEEGELVPTALQVCFML